MLNCISPFPISNEKLMSKASGTYNTNRPNGDEAWGGCASHVRIHEQFVFPIPDAILSAMVPSMFRTGLTVYSPMVHLVVALGRRSLSLASEGVWILQFCLGRLWV